MQPVTVKIEFAVNAKWIELCTRETDLFLSTYAGYWVRGVEWGEERGWLVWESTDKTERDQEPYREEAIAAWREGRALPAHWFRLDRDAAARAWGFGVRWYGEDWYEDGDCERWDVVVQLALLGEVRYG